jgi:general stress protein YciG
MILNKEGEEMAGTKEGGRKAAAKNKEIYGEDFYKRIGRAGGSVTGVEKGFSLMTIEERAELGRRGGKKSKRGKAGEKYAAPTPKHQSLWKRLIKGATV